MTEEGNLIRLSMCSLNLEGLQVKSDVRPKTFRELKKSDLKVGDSIGFYNERMEQDYFGKIIKLNPNRARVKTNAGESWDVPYKHLFSVVEATCKQDSGIVIEGVVLPGR